MVNWDERKAAAKGWKYNPSSYKEERTPPLASHLCFHCREKRWEEKARELIDGWATRWGRYDMAVITEGLKLCVPCAEALIKNWNTAIDKWVAKQNKTGELALE